MILGIALILTVISFEILLYRVDRRIELIMKDLGIEDKPLLKKILEKIKKRKK